MYKIAVLGEKDSIIGFSALGLEIFPAESATEARRLFKELTANKDKYAIIYLTETFYSELSAEIEKFTESVTPAVILIPGAKGSLGLGQSALDNAAYRAVGANIL